MADNATPPPNGGEAAGGPKAGVPAPPPLELVASVPSTLDGGQAKVQWTVAGRDGDDGDFEYFAVIRVPEVDLVSKMDGQKALAVTLKPDRHVIVAQINAVGGAPLAGTKVQAIDPETNLPAGDPVETDDQGRVVAIVPENKPHQFQIVDDDHDDTPAAESENGGEGDDLNDPVLFVRLLAPTGEPKAGLEVEVKPVAGGGASRKVKTNERGEVRVEGLGAGAYTISGGGKAAKVHTLVEVDLTVDPEPYRAIMN